MHLRIIIHDEAADDLDQIVGWLAIDYPLNAERAADRFVDEIRRLSKLPRMGGFARENGCCDLELRQIVVFSYRVIYTVRRREVHILRIVHAARRTLGAQDVPSVK